MTVRIKPGRIQRKAFSWVRKMALNPKVMTASNSITSVLFFKQLNGDLSLDFGHTTCHGSAAYGQYLEKRKSGLWLNDYRRVVQVGTNFSMQTKNNLWAVCYLARAS